MVLLSAFESLSISVERSYSDCRVFLQCMELSDSIELNSSKMFLICHNANNYAAFIFVYMEIMHVKFIIFILSLLNPKIIQLMKNFLRRILTMI